MAALERAGGLLEQLGHKVFTIDTDVFQPEAIQPFLDVINTGFAEYDGIDWDKVEPHNKASYEAAKKADSLTPIRALGELQRLTRRVVSRWGQEFDLLVTPTMTIEPPVAGTVLAEMHANPDAPAMTVVAMVAFTAVYNITGQPAINLPLHWSASGLPIGVQIVGGPWQEALLASGGGAARRGRTLGRPAATYQLTLRRSLRVDRDHDPAAGLAGDDLLGELEHVLEVVLDGHRLDQAGGKFRGEPVPRDLPEVERAAHGVDAGERDAAQDEGVDRRLQVRAAGQAARGDASAVAGPAQQGGERRSPDAVDGARVLSPSRAPSAEPRTARRAGSTSAGAEGSQVALLLGPSANGGDLVSEPGEDRGRRPNPRLRLRR